MEEILLWRLKPLHKVGVEGATLLRGIKSCLTIEEKSHIFSDSQESEFHKEDNMKLNLGFWGNFVQAEEM